LTTVAWPAFREGGTTAQGMTRHGNLRALREEDDKPTIRTAAAIERWRLWRKGGIVGLSPERSRMCGSFLTALRLG
jgi:hypothetical protein